METYKILRFKQNKKPRTINTGLTLEEAQAHCSSPDTRRTDKHGNVIWFDGYTKE